MNNAKYLQARLQDKEHFIIEKKITLHGSRALLTCDIMNYNSLPDVIFLPITLMIQITWDPVHVFNLLLALNKIIVTQKMDVLLMPISGRSFYSADVFINTHC